MQVGRPSAIAHIREFLITLAGTPYRLECLRPRMVEG
jgi:hypothetical protein